jgi:hypothetical protein
MPLSEADTHAKLVNPALYSRHWTEDHIKREETTGAVELIAGKARRRANPNRKAVIDTRTPVELLSVIEAKGIEVSAAVAVLRGLLERPLQTPAWPTPRSEYDPGLPAPFRPRPLRAIPRAKHRHGTGQMGRANNPFGAEAAISSKAGDLRYFRQDWGFLF